MRFILISFLAVFLYGQGQIDGQVLQKEIADNVSSPKMAADITPSNTVDLPNITKAIWVGGAGTLKVDMQNGGTVTLSAVPAGTMIKIAAKRVYATGTTATLLIAFF